MSLSQRLFAAAYEIVNGVTERRVAPYRRQTAGRAKGDVLEVGAGTGANLDFYPPDVRITVVEPNPHMAKRLVRRAARLGRQVEVVPSTGERLPFPDASFDTVVTTLVLCMVSDLDQVVREARRVLRPGGVFYFYEHVAARTPWMRRFHTLLNPFWRVATTGCNLNRDIAGAIRSAGFQHVEVTDFYLFDGTPLALPNIVGAATA